jgi:hypothetical protein
MKNVLVLCCAILALASCKKDTPLKKDADTVAVTPAVVTSIYVNGATGNDANTGSTASTPLKTIQAALNKTVNGVGATIMVAAGTYHERLWWPTSGASSTAPITLTNYNSGTVILDGTNATNNTQDQMIAIPSRSHIRISNISITNNIRASAVGIYGVGTGTDVQITSCKISNIGWTSDSTAIPNSSNNANPLVFVGDSAAAYSEIYIGGNQIFACNTGYSEGLTMAGNINNFLIENNIVHHIRNIGIDMTGHYSWTNTIDSVNMARNGNVRHNTVYNCISPVTTNGGIYVDGGKWINIEGNTCFQNSVGIVVGCENNGFTAEGINIRDNFIYNNLNAAVLIGSNQPNSKVTFSTVTNNTMLKNYQAGGWGGEISIQNTDNLSIKNNVVYSNSDIIVIALFGYNSTNLSMDYNRYYGASGNAATSTFDWYPTGTTYGSLAAFRTATGLDAHSTYANPSLMSVTLPSPNLHLSNTSTCINAGDPAFVAASGELDYDSQTRVQHNRVDIGGDETSL